MNLILTGLPGAGKGTQGERIIDTYSIPHISTGDMLRSAIEAESEVGLLAKSFIDRGDLVPDEVIIAVVKDRLSQADAANGFLLDGFPRTVEQAVALDTITTVDAVIDIDVDPSILMERLTGRIICRTCGATYHKVFNPPKVEGTCDRCGSHDFYQRSDDTPEAVENRLSVNIANGKPIKDYYQNLGKLHEIDGARDIDVVFTDVKSVIDAI
ncbi:MAG: adenylate kinase [Lactobacillales bacterium]|jgi:adenylate kinase|nr:adenylate kinase [Lactobacillales bacterium]